MHEIIVTRELAPKIRFFEVHAPSIAAKVKPGQFIILVIDENGERIPLTIADCNTNNGTISFVFNEVGKTFEFVALPSPDRSGNLSWYV